MTEFHVEVEAEWRGSTTFVFNDEAEADRFRADVNKGDLGAIVEAGDIEPNAAAIINFEAGSVQELP